MSYEVTSTPFFEREAKYLIKKYPSLKNEIDELAKSLAEQPVQGIALANNCYKIRLSIKSKRKGKRGGARVISCVIAISEVVLLLSIYDKAEQATITNNEIKKRLEVYLNNL